MGVSDDALGWKLLTSPTHRLILELRTPKRRKLAVQQEPRLCAEEPSAVMGNNRHVIRLFTRPAAHVTTAVLLVTPLLIADHWFAL